MIQARAVRGRFRTLRWWSNALLIAILFAVPWIQIGGEPLVLLDIPARRFHVFGLVIFPQELYFLWLILAALALALFFFTALLGRLWCGWACPQTVFTDLFAAVGRFIQGWRSTRPPDRVAPWRKVATHAVWLLMSWVTGFHLVAYFHSPYDLLGTLFKEGRLYPTAFAFHMVIMAITYLDFAIVRQTFCKYLCPYARFQGVLFDRDTLVIGYDARRGEPRGKRGRTSGDCVDCGLCVQVCPTGIDIRDGLQLECIACTQCIDACNGVMARLERPANLIGYRSWVGLEGLRPMRWLRPRVLVYGTLLSATVLAFGILVVERNPMSLHVAHNRSALTSRAADGRLGNAFTLRVENRDRAEHAFRIRLEGEEADFALITGVNPIRVAAASAEEARVFVMAPDGWKPKARSPLRFVLESVDDPNRRVVRSIDFLTAGAAHGG